MLHTHQLALKKFAQYRIVIERMKKEGKTNEVEPVEIELEILYKSYIMRAAVIKNDDLKYQSIITSERIQEKLDNICFALAKLGSGYVDQKPIPIKHQRTSRLLTRQKNEQSENKRQNNYHPMRTFKAWMLRLQSKENRKIPPEVIRDVSDYIEKHNLDPTMCESIREALRATKHSAFNSDAVMIRKTAFKIKPLQFTEKEASQIFTMFGKIIHVMEQIKPDSVTNCPYHPYFAYHIIDNMLGDGDQRRKELPRCIHLQSDDTLIGNDRLLETICPYVSGLKYKPTNRLDYL